MIAAEDVRLVQHWLDRYQRDRLGGFRWASEPMRHAAQHVSDFTETFVRGSNSSGKTTWGSALGIALARGLDSLDGVKLPRLRSPNVGWVLGQSYKQMVESVQQAYLDRLGKWPHKIVYSQGEAKGYIEVLWVATARCEHGMDEKCKHCSKIMLHCAESKSAIGGRIDWAHADEVPDEKVWREIRFRKRAGERIALMISATPMERHGSMGWEWLKNDFDGALGVPRDGKVEIVSTMRDNRFLTTDDIAFFERMAKNDPIERARLYGEYVDTTGSSPFKEQFDVLQAWLARARPGKITPLQIRTERDFADGRHLVAAYANVEIWEPFDPAEAYLGVFDPCLGINDKRHDPAAGHIYARRRPRMVARYSGYLPPYGLGSLAAAMGRLYGNAWLDVDMTGGYGGPVITALTQEHYRNIVRDSHEDTFGQIEHRFGFRITGANRAEIVGGVQQALAEDSVVIPSSDCIRSLMATRVDIGPTGKEKWKAGAGAHDEDLICLGRALHLMGTLYLPPARERSPRERLGIAAPSRPLPFEPATQPKWR